MPKASDIKMVAVYVTDAEKKTLAKAARLQHRSLSNYLLVTGLEKAAELGVVTPTEPTKKRPSR